MCVAIFKPEGVELGETDLFLAYEENPDGCGFAYRGKERVEVYRGLWSFDEFMSKYEKFEDRELLVHFRWASIGVLSKGNTHPIPFGKHALVHNGHMARWGNKAESDTVQWTKNVLQPIMKHSHGIIQSESMQRLLERDIGQSKIIVMPNHGDVVILNERLGIWDSCGAWFSQVHFRDAMDWECDEEETEETYTARFAEDDRLRLYGNMPDDDGDSAWLNYRFGR